MRVVITGAEGFLGWHLSCLLRSAFGVEPVRLGRADLGRAARLESAVAEADVVYHLAGVNRADSDLAVEEGNRELAEVMASALAGSSAHVVYANSIHADSDTPYGRGKAEVARVLARVATVADVKLPNLFGEHGRPAYNSFVATFAHEIANGREPTVTVDRSVPLLHAQGAARALVRASIRRESHEVRPAGQEMAVRDVLERFKEFHALYAERGELPDLSCTLTRDLFNTYRSYLFPQQFPIYPQMYADPRGMLVETSRSHGGTGQGFVSTTHPGRSRGDHYHLHKVERFFVVAGEAEIALRRLFHDEVVRFKLSGDRPGFVDMPTMWVHNIRNTGQTDVVTTFWADQLLDPADPDQYPERVIQEETAE